LATCNEEEDGKVSVHFWDYMKGVQIKTNPVPLPASGTLYMQALAFGYSPEQRQAVLFCDFYELFFDSVV
jgi:hypothetical protein